MSPIIEERLSILDTLHLNAGAGDDLDTACVMQAVAYIAGEPWSDHPECACPVITAFMISWNDGSTDEQRQELKRYIPLLVGSRSTPEVEARRGRLASDWLIRTFTPAWLRLAGLSDHAKRIEALGDTTGLSADEIADRVVPIVSAADSAADSAAYSAADSALQPTMLILRSSAFDLLDRMLAVAD